MKNKLIIVIAAVVILAVFIAVRQNGNRAPQTAEAPVATQTPSVAPSTALASGNVNDITNELLQNSTAEADNFNTEIGDKTTLSADAQEIGNVGQTYDENSL
ncbi:MAG: hypothetical protein Q7S09_05825 [bacterium]|nr:hypothetical protein [bacterium]